MGRLTRPAPKRRMASMRVLVVNSGSSSLKVRLLEVGEEGNEVNELFQGAVERIGTESHLRTASGTRAVEARDHAQALAVLMEQVTGPVNAVGHRVVHGGDLFMEPVVLTPKEIAALEGLRRLAPLHNPPAVAGIKAAKELLGESVPAVAVFDTAFYRALPAHAAEYAIPHELAERHGIRRYGFHGIAHHYALSRYCVLSGIPESGATVVSLHLGNGCSATAIQKGRAVDTSMGFTPLEGLVMGTRSGDVDPAIVTFLGREGGLSLDEVEELLNKRSGLLGVSGLSQDVRDLIAAAEDGHEQAHLALELFCYRAKKYLGAYLAALGGAQAVLFGGGIGEHSAWVRSRICEGMEWCGLFLDESRNGANAGFEGLISADHSNVAGYVILSDEESLIAQETVRCLASRH
jgi:acetate kinase